MADDLEQLRQELAGQYDVIREVGRGGMGVVYLARELSLDRVVALKVLPLGQRLGDKPRERFRREAQMAARLSHPNIVPVYGYGETDTVVYYTMAFVEGESLEEREKRVGRLSEPELENLCSSVASALDHAHRRGLVHRDVKPSNVLFDSETDRILLTDFGIGRALGSNQSSVAGMRGSPTALTASGAMLGTPEYMAPEQLSDAAVDARADLYSLAATVYEAACGTSPFRAPTPEQTIAKKLTGLMEPLRRARPDVSARLAAIVERCLERDPGDRPESAARLLALLDADDAKRAPARSGVLSKLNPRVPFPLVAGYLGGSWITTQLLGMFESAAHGLWSRQSVLFVLSAGLFVSIWGEWRIMRGHWLLLPNWVREWGGLVLSLTLGVLVLLVGLTIG